MRKTKYIILLFFCFSGVLKAQTDFDLTQKWFNESIYNPAATGNSFTTGLFMHARAQWLTMEGAPTTQAVSFDTYVDEVNSAFGLAIIGDQIGYMSNYTAKLSYAYYLPLRLFNKSSISFGLSLGLLNRKRNIEDNFVFDPSDPILMNAKASEFSPDFDFGFEYRGPFKLGTSIRHIGRKNMLESGIQYLQTVNVWTYASSKFNVAYNLSIEPLASHIYRNNVHRFEAGAIFYFLKTKLKQMYSDKLWVGAVYRTSGQFAVMSGINITSKLRVGYSFDYGVGDLVSISKFGTHEIFLGWQFNRIFYKEEDCPVYKNIKNKRR